MLSASFDPHQRRITWGAALLALCSGLVTPSLSIARIFDTSGFEGYTNNSILEGQFQTMEIPPPRKWLNAGDGGSTAVVQNVISKSGKAVKVTKGSNSDDRWAIPVGDLGYPHYQYITINWDMNVTPTGAASGVFGPFIGVDSYDDTQGPVDLLGALGVDATTGEVLYQAQGTGVLTPAGSVTFNTWHSYQIRLDFINDVYKIFVDGSERASVGFVDGASSNFSDADIATFAAAPDTPSRSQVGIGYFDNFKVLEIAPPDFDIDGDVDGDDLTIWQNSYATDDGGDADLDGDTDGDDFLIWQQFFGYGTPLSVNVAAVPEPSSLFLAIISLAILGQRRS